jgi:hypothetical protein
MDAQGFAEVGIGHNISPEMLTGTALRPRLEAIYADQTDRRDDLLAAVERIPKITDDDSAGRVSDYIKQITAACKNAEGARTAAKEPYMEGGRTVDGFFTKGIVEPLMKVKRLVEASLTAYLQDKSQREREARMKAEREARALEDQLRKEADARAAAANTTATLDSAIAAETAANQASVNRFQAEQDVTAKAAELSRTRGDYGSVASLRTTWEYEVTDTAAVPRAFLMVNDAAIKAHIKARHIHAPPGGIPGLRFFEKTSAAVR